MQRTKKGYLAVFIILLCMGLFACKNNSSDTESDNNLLELTNIEVTAIATDTNPQEKESQRLIKVIKHDAIFGADGTYSDLITEYEYNQEGYLISEVSYDSKGELQDDYVEYTYDNNGNMIRQNNYVKDCLMGYFLCEYNQEKQLIKEELYKLNDSLDSFEMTGKVEYTYDSNGNLVKTETNETPITIINSYDETNRIIKKEFSNGLVEKYYYVSEESELVAKKVVSVPAFTTTYKYLYDSKGNLTEEVIETDNGSSSQRITYEYEEVIS